MGRLHSLIAVLGLLGGCNAVFGIEDTRGPDSDGDGTSDSSDNCPLVANADQADTDGDRLGDACDPCDGPQSGVDSDNDGIDDLCDACPTGSNHDEDGDGFLDGCDACPGQADSGEDADGDGIGDLCDPDPLAQNHRVFFDGFGPARSDWRTYFAPWESRGDAYGPVTDGGIGAWNIASAVSGTGWSMEVAAVTPNPPQNLDAYGFEMREIPGGYWTQECELDFDTGAWRPNDFNNVSYVPGAVVRFKLRSLGNDQYECTIDGTAAPPMDSTPTPGVQYLPTLTSYFGTDVLWVDVIAGPSAP